MKKRRGKLFGPPYPLFEGECRRRGLPLPQREVMFHVLRGWKFDFAWTRHFVALEVDGGGWTGGRHTRGAGFAEDMDKLNEGQLAGWLVLHCVPKAVEDGSVFRVVERALAARTPAGSPALSDSAPPPSCTPSP